MALGLENLYEKFSPQYVQLAIDLKTSILARIAGHYKNLHERMIGMELSRTLKSRVALMIELIE